MCVSLLGLSYYVLDDIKLNCVINCLVVLLTMYLLIANAAQRLTGSLVAAVVEVKADIIVNYRYCAVCVSACQ